MVKSVNKELNLSWNGYTSLCIVYAVFSMANWVAPSIVSFFGPKMAMILGALTYSLFVANFLLPLSFGLYFVSVIIGFGAAVIWTAQGNFLTNNSTPETSSRNSGIFWALFQSSMLFGNLFVYFEFRGEESISSTTRLTVYGFFTVGGIIGTLLLLTLKSPPVMSIDYVGPKESIIKSWKLLKARRMILLTVTFFYTG